MVDQVLSKHTGGMIDLSNATDEMVKQVLGEYAFAVIPPPPFRGRTEVGVFVMSTPHPSLPP